MDLNMWLVDRHRYLKPPGCQTIFSQAPSGENKCCTIGIVHEHRFAFYYWADFAIHSKYGQPILITVDYHNDVGGNGDVIPKDLNFLNLRESISVALFSWLRLHPLNDGHILPALYLGFFSDVYVLLRAPDDDRRLDKIVEQEDQDGAIHKVYFFNNERKLLNEIRMGIRKGWCVYLDLDLDYFAEENPDTQKAKGTEILWSPRRIASFLKAKKGLIQTIFPSIIGMTIALEPEYCGGLLNCFSALNMVNKHLFDGTLGTANTKWKKQN